jgi:cation transport protein ChaC
MDPSTTALPATGAAPSPEPGALIAELHRDWGPRTDLWVFGYASLIWRPEFRAAEQRTATVRGWHRALRMRSHINRGTPERHGLVYALLPGGSCRGEVHRLPPDRVDEELRRLWAREMVLPIYTPRWLPCRTDQGVVPALAFTLSRRSDACLPRLDDTQMLEILRHARGRYGSTLDYLVQTAQALHARGLCDRETDRLVRLAARHGLVQGGPAAAPRDTPPSGSGNAATTTAGSSTSIPRAG